MDELERAKLEALAEFAAGAGHEINNPLAVISGRAQLLLRDPMGTQTYDFPIIELRGSMQDFTRRETYDYVEGFLEAMVRDQGMDGWMADFGEWLPMDATLADGRAAPLVHNLYPTQWHRASREVMDRARPDGDWVVFSRSGWSREHEVAQIVWIGDQEADFSDADGLATVIPALLNLGMSGLPFVTHDVAGFSGGPKGVLPALAQRGLLFRSATVKSVRSCATSSASFGCACRW